jgi:large conductance mechanosensitive channel
MFKGFREFLLRGNVVDLATAVIIGVAFNDVVNGIIKGIIDPLIALLSPSAVKSLGTALLLGPFQIGLVLSAIINFVLKVAVVYFFIVRPFSSFAARFAPKPAGPPADVVLLTEIRDLMKQDVEGKGRT